jgi:uncharacterized membrane protein
VPWWGVGALVAVTVVAAALAVYLVRGSRLRRFGPSAPTASLAAAEDVLARRFAAGEISEEEYTSRLAVLLRGAAWTRASRNQPATTPDEM